MREVCTGVLKTHFRRKLVAARADMNISQSDMAQMLSMSLRSYIDLESGRSGCSAVTLVLFLIKVCPDPQAFLEDLRKAMEREPEGVA